MLCLFHDRSGTGYRRARIDQLGWAVGGATGVAVVAVLVFGLTLGAGALDESVRQEHGLFRIEQLGNSLALDITVVAQFEVDLAGQLAVLFAVGAVIIVKGNIELGKILLMLLIDLGDHLFGLDPHLLSLEHDRCTVGIIGTDIMTLMATKFLEAGQISVCMYSSMWPR